MNVQEMGSDPHPRYDPEWNQIKECILKRDQYRCQGCGMTESQWRGVDLHVHHINPVKNGGTNDENNLVVVCNRCHWKIHREGPIEEKYPLKLLENERPTWSNPRRRERFNIGERHAQILKTLIEDGPTQRKDIAAEIGLKSASMGRYLEGLMVTDYIARVERGVYAYVPLEQYWLAEEQREQQDGDAVLVESYDPDSDELEDENVIDAIADLEDGDPDD